MAEVRDPSSGKIHELPHVTSPGLDKVLANLELMAATLNLQKGAKIGQGQIDLAARFLQAGLPWTRSRHHSRAQIRVIPHPGASLTAIRSAKVLRTGEAVSFTWENGTLSIVFSEPSRDQPHKVIALKFTHEVLQQGPTNASRPSATRRPPAP